MEKQQTISARLVEIGDFKAWYFDTKSPRLESVFSFPRDHFSQKLVYSVMNIAHKHGFACAAPVFGNESNPDQVIFCLGAELPSSKSIRKYSAKIGSCLADIARFSEDFSKQLDFSIVDLSMFGGVDFDYFDPLMLATVRDQHYDGLWEKFHKDMMEDDREEDADLITRCKVFEDKNGKDIALVSAQLDETLSMVEDALAGGEQ